MNIVIVGASLAGLRTVEALRAGGCDDPIVLIGDEEHEPYDRPPLSKEILTGKLVEDDILLRGTDLADLDVDLRLGMRAIELDAQAKIIELDHGMPVAYDELVAATGARGRRLGHLHELAGLES